MLLLLSPIAFAAGMAWSCWATLQWRGAWRVAAAVPLLVVRLYAILVLVPDTYADRSSHNQLPFELGLLFWPSLPYMALLAAFRLPRRRGDSS